MFTIRIYSKNGDIPKDNFLEGKTRQKIVLPLTSQFRQLWTNSIETAAENFKCPTFRIRRMRVAPRAPFFGNPAYKDPQPEGWRNFNSSICSLLRQHQPNLLEEYSDVQFNSSSSPLGFFFFVVEKYVKKGSHVYLGNLTRVWKMKKNPSSLMRWQTLTPHPEEN